MARYKVTLEISERLPASVEKKLKQVFGDVPIHTVEKIVTPESRADRLDEAISGLEDSIDNAKTAVEELKDEMQSWYDSIPENLQQGDKAGEVQEAIDLESELESLSVPSNDVSFPSMF